MLARQRRMAHEAWRCLAELPRHRQSLTGSESGVAERLQADERVRVIVTSYPGCDGNARLDVR